MQVSFSYSKHKTVSVYINNVLSRHLQSFLNWFISNTFRDYIKVCIKECSHKFTEKEGGIQLSQAFFKKLSLDT